MLRIRLQRRGKRNYATYRVVVADRHAPIKGKFVADVGFYNPHTDKFEVDAEKVQTWISNGAKPTATVNNLLVEKKVIKGKKVTSWKPKKAKQKEESQSAEEEKKPAEKGEAGEGEKTEEKPDQKTEQKEEDKGKGK